MTNVVVTVSSLHDARAGLAAKAALSDSKDPTFADSKASSPRSSLQKVHVENAS